MSLVTLKESLYEARKNNEAVPQFNINSYLWAECILEASAELESTVIIGVTDRNVKRLGGYSFIYKMIVSMIDEWKISVPIILHLDHGQTVENCKKAIDAGFSSVMFDGSSLTLEDNISRTKEVVKYAAAFNVSTEAEIGQIGGTEDGITSGICHANPIECKMLAEETKVDALAAALGSVHGKYVGSPNLRFDIMKELNAMIEQPLVLHGASGISNSDIKKAINLGHAKINYNTELNQSIAHSTRKLLTENKDLYDPAIILLNGKKALKKVIYEKVKLLRNQ